MKQERKTQDSALVVIIGGGIVGCGTASACTNTAIGGVKGKAERCLF